MSAAGDIAGAQREKLAHMAGQIAAFFASYPEEQAAAQIAEHINQFWGRRMRADFLDAFEADASTLPPLVARALPLVRRPKD